MGALDGRVVIVTGAGRGIGRAHALLFAASGAKVVVNDLGGSVDGAPGQPSAAHNVVDEIGAVGGTAMASTHDVTRWDDALALVEEAKDAFGDVHALVNNAGILRDRMVFNMSEEEWDSVVRVHLKGHFLPTRHLAAYWRARAKAGDTTPRAVVNTTSTSGLVGNPGQSNYGAAKAGIAALTVIAAQELSRYGVRVNAIAPGARTRMTDLTPGLAELVAPPADEKVFDSWDPANVSPLAAYLCSPGCIFTGRVFFVLGGEVRLFSPWNVAEGIEKPGRWTVEELAERLPELDA
jgi:NAD(P)-dependent dehydrogenase (short-subunit alcohol dehydrogenase family)